MKINYVAIFLLTVLSTAKYGKQQAPMLLVNATQCLTAKNALQRSEAPALSFGYVLDSKSYPGEKIIYVANYTAAGRSGGVVFTIFLTKTKDRAVFNIQNNATFVRSKDGLDGIDFIEPPLGGGWTQQHLVSAIRQIEARPIFMIPTNDLLAPPASIQCESYTDRK